MFYTFNEDLFNSMLKTANIISLLKRKNTSRKLKNMFDTSPLDWPQYPSLLS